MKASHLYFFGFITMAVPTVLYLYVNGGIQRYSENFDYTNILMIIGMSVAWTIFFKFLDKRYVVNRRK